MDTIKLIKARQIFDSRGNPTLEVEVTCSDGSVHRAAVPIGGSTVIYEAPKLRDGGSDYLGMGVLKAADNVNAIIGPALIDKDPTEHTKIDASMPLAWQLRRRMEKELGSSVSPFYAGYKYRSPVKPYRVKPGRGVLSDDLLPEPI